MSKRKTAIVTLLIGVVIGYTSGFIVSAKSDQKSAVSAPNTPTISQLLTLVNAERAKNSVAPLKEDPRLDASAQMKANDEVAFNYFDHTNPITKVFGPKLIDTTGLQCVYESENLTENTVVNDSQHAVTAWINSPVHHAAMIDPKYSLTGFGIDSNQIVEHFCQTP